MSRKRFSEREVLETLAWQGVFVECFRCRQCFFRINWTTVNGGSYIIIQALKAEREHLHEYKLGGPDTPKNCRYSCSECHSKITNGTKATTAGSSKQRVAKVRRLVNPKPSKRPMKSSGRKIPSRPFQTRKKP